MAACDDGSDGGESGPRVPSVTSLPDFPSGSTPAASKQAAELVLAEMRETLALYQLEEEIDEFVWEYLEERVDDWSKYSFANQPIPGANIKVSASGTESHTATGGFKKENELKDKFKKDYGDDWEADEDLYDSKYAPERDKIQFAANDRGKGTWQERIKAEVTADKLIDTVTIVKGSTFEESRSEWVEDTVTKAGTYETIFGETYDDKYNEIEDYKVQTVIGCTVTTSSGSIKIILGVTDEGRVSDKNGGYTEKFKCSGSLKIYGANNKVLINHPINDNGRRQRDYDDALVMIGYREDWDDGDWDEEDEDEYSISAPSVRKAGTRGPKR